MKIENIYIAASVGGIVGYFFIHPLLMIISHMMIEERLSHAHSSIFEIVINEGGKAFSLNMLPWAISLTVLGSLVSYFYQANQEKRREVIRSAERLNHLLTAGPAVVYSCRPSGDYGATFVSENIFAQLGYTPHQFTEGSGFWLQHIHPEDRDRVMAGLPCLFEHGHHFHDYRFLNNAGEYRWMRDELRLIRDDTGSPLEIIGTWMDISELKHLQQRLQEAHDHLEHRVTQRTEELEETNKQLRYEVAEKEKAQDALTQKNEFLGTVIDSLPYPFYVIDTHDFTIKMANSKVPFNEKRKGKTCYALTHQRETPCETTGHECPLDIVKRTGKPAIIEHLHFDENKQQRHFEVHGYPIFDEKNNIVQMIEYAIDISERKQLEKDKETLILELQGALDQIKTLSGIIPICMYCKEIRDDKGYWNKLEQFISEHSDAQFSHGICPKCMKEKFDEFLDEE